MSAGGITIYGASDDLVEVEGSIRREFDCISGDAELIVASSDGALRVFMRYENNGCWSAAVGQIDEGARIPWPVSIVASEKSRYSAAVVIDCPLDAQVTIIGGDPE